MARHSSKRFLASTRKAKYGRSPAHRPRSWRHDRPSRIYTPRSCGPEGFDEALTRAVLYVIAAARGRSTSACALALNVARQQLMHLSLAEFKVVVRDQAFLLAA